MQKELRQYQSDIVKAVVDSKKDLIVVLPTGAGKTVIAHAIIEEQIAAGETVMFIVPRLELVNQASDEFGDLNPDVIWQKKMTDNGSGIIVASKDSLMNKTKGLPKDFIAIFDEAHYGIKGSYNIVKRLAPKRVLGLTATPERMDGKALLKGDDKIHEFGIFDEVLQKETVPSLIRKGYLAPLKYYARPIEGITDIKPDTANAEELSERQMRKIMDDNHIWGDLVQSYEEYAVEGINRRPALGFTNTIAMAEDVCKIFNNAGYDFRVIHGGMKVKEREELIGDLRDGVIDGLVNAALLTYGFDCPPVSYAFSVRHIKSRPLWFQIIGRILRTFPGKEDAIFVDHGDSISEFSEPDCSLPIMDEAIRWRVNGESKEEKKEEKRKRKKVEETMKLISELDPLPSQLVEITVEDTWERLIRIIKRQRAENEKLTKEKNYLAQDNAILQAQNRKLQNSAGKKKVIDKDATFEYTRRNYMRYRKYIETERGIHGNAAHDLVRKQFEYDEEKLDFYYDKLQLEKSLKFWDENYEKYLARSR